jgi:hypothetical protein
VIRTRGPATGSGDRRQRASLAGGSLVAEFLVGSSTHNIHTQLTRYGGPVNSDVRPLKYRDKKRGEHDEQRPGGA